MDWQVESGLKRQSSSAQPVQTWENAGGASRTFCSKLAFYQLSRTILLLTRARSKNYCSIRFWRQTQSFALSAMYLGLPQQ